MRYKGRSRRRRRLRYVLNVRRVGRERKERETVSVSKGLGGLGESDGVATEVVDGVVLAEEGVTV